MSADPVVRAMLRVVIDGQAWLYANQLLPAHAAEEDYEKLMTEWKQKSADLVEEILAGNNEE